MSALVASLFAVGASPAAAIDEDSKADATSSTSACVGEAPDDHGFTDLGSLEAAAVNINCLAYYGITVGKTADTFAPNDDVKRSEMALFLYRAAGLMGVDLMGGDMMADFGDVSELGEDRQNAIKALARNGILEGRGDMAFEPHADITRAEMAVALVNLVAKVSDKVTKSDDGTYSVVVGDGKVDVFGDAFASAPAPVNSAISAAYELGITTGVGDGKSFAPHGSVPRRDMATFIVRALAHTNVRPQGLTAQAAGSEVLVSVRDADFKPLANRHIDAFYADSDTADRAFQSSGACSSRSGAGGSTVVNAGSVKCTIDRLDPPTDSMGNATLSPITDVGDGVTVWVWTGDSGAKVDADTVLYEVAVTEQPTDTSGAVRRATVSRDLAAGLTARFGAKVTYTIQIEAGLDDDGAAAATVNDATMWVDTGPDDAGDKYKLTVNYPSGAIDTKDLPVDSDGRAEFTLTVPNPTAKPDDDSVTLSYGLVGVPVEDDSNTADVDESSLVPDFNSEGDSDESTDGYQGSVTFSEASAVVHSVSVEAVYEYAAAPDADTPQTGNRLIIKATDQYGNPKRNVRVQLNSNRIIDTDNNRPTGSKLPPTAYVQTGEVSISYGYTGTAQSETITVEHNSDVDNTCVDNPDATTDACGRVTVYWTMAGESTTDDGTDTAVTGNLLQADADSNTLILGVTGADTPTVYTYDGNDQFVAGGVFVTMADFEENLAEALASDAERMKADSSASRSTVQVSSYKPGEAGDVARFALTRAT